MKVESEVRVVIDEVFRYSGRREMWAVNGETEVPDDVATELIARHGDVIRIAQGSSLTGGSYANRMMTTTTGSRCAAVKSNGETCGRELPCRYHREK